MGCVMLKVPLRVMLKIMKQAKNRPLRVIYLLLGPKKSTLVAQGGAVIFFPPKVSHLGWLGGHIRCSAINYLYINVNYEIEKLWGEKILQDPLWHPD